MRQRQYRVHCYCHHHHFLRMIGYILLALPAYLIFTLWLIWWIFKIMLYGIFLAGFAVAGMIDKYHDLRQFEGWEQWLALRHPNLYAAMWYMHLVRNKKS